MTNEHSRLVVWIDHKVAHLYAFTATGAREIAVIHAPDQGAGHIHHKAGSTGSGRVALSHEFLDEIARGLEHVQQLLIIGSAEAKNGFKAYLERQWPGVAEKIIGVEPMRKSSKGQISAFARPHFLRADQMRRK